MYAVADKRIASRQYAFFGGYDLASFRGRSSVQEAISSQITNAHGVHSKLAFQKAIMIELFVNTKQRILEPVELSEDAEIFNNQIRQLLQCDIFLFTSSIDGRINLLVDEDCLLKSESEAVWISLMPRPLFGNLLLLGRDRDTGELTDLPADINVLSVAVEFVDNELSAIFRQEALQYVEGLVNGERH